jgi:anti-sigma factor RsiW
MTRHYGEELQDLLDGRLDSARRAEVEAHVAGCERCRRELEALRWVKTQVPAHISQVETPADVSARVRAALSEPPRSVWWTGRMRRHAWIAGALAAAVLLAVYLRGHEGRPLPELVAGDFAAYENGTLGLDFESADPKAVEAHFAGNGVRFPTHVYDLGMMNYRLVGGRVHRLDDRTSALFAYRGPGDVRLMCQMYEGNVRDLPATDDVRQHNGFTFHVYRQGDVTMVFWQEDGIVCVLASDAPLEDVVQLAFAKAMRVD